ncbi:MAG: hypothetical protein ACU85E_15250 [Gammaproteobacteria bacterium]
MLPEKYRSELFERLSVKTMRHVYAVSRNKAQGLVKHIYGMITEDLFY